MPKYKLNCKIIANLILKQCEYDIIEVKFYTKRIADAKKIFIFNFKFSACCLPCSRSTAKRGSKSTKRHH
ncbi:hypothetical protein HCMG_01271 [Helicobacter canadensis MIT 98-5491]|nr:hypothetical protein HCMG_01271 [Helicobacter canadensis MIT 98-5491]